MATSAIASADLPLAPGWDDEAWDDLLNYIDERRVVPIVGPELLRMATDDGTRLRYGRIARAMPIGPETEGRITVDGREAVAACGADPHPG